MAHRPAHDRRLPARRRHQGRDREPPALIRPAWRGAALALAGAGLACAAPVWDAARFAAGRPELTGASVGRLGDATPYLIAADDVLHLFLCRWSLDAPLRTSLPPDASAAERALLERVLRAWEGAVPGLRFALAEGDAPLRLRFRERGGEAAHTAARCRVAPPFGRPGALDAGLAEAEVSLRRAERDAWGRLRPLSPAELAGSAAHELGHALGLQGHARRGAGALRREPGAVRRLGERVLEGAPLVERAVRALYALPSGVRVGRRALAPGATAGVDAIARRAAARGADAAWLQLGDAVLRVAWGPGEDLVYYLNDPRELARGAHDFARTVALPLR